MSLRVVVVGAGAVGSFLGGTLARAGHDVTLVGRSEVPSPGRGELRLLEAGGETLVPVTRAAIDDAPAEPPDLVLLAVKLFDLAAALATVERWPDAPVLTVQNGIGAEQMAAKLRTSPVVAGSLTTAIEPVTGGVRRLRRGGIGLADARGVDAAVLASLAAAFEAGGLPARVYPDAVAMKWSKLIANLVGNATGAILDMDPGAIYRDAAGFDVDRRQLLEARAVMRRLGTRPVDLPGAPIRPLLFGLRLPAVLGRPVLARAIGGARGGKSPSLRLHVRGGDGFQPHAGPTEVRWLNGAVDREATALGMGGVGVNGRLEALVDEVASDPERAAWFAGRRTGCGPRWSPPS